MRILILSNIFPPGFIGGYELGALDVAKGLQACAHEVLVLTSDYFLDDGLELSPLNVSRSLVCNSLSHERDNKDCIHHLYYSFHNIRVLGSAIRRFKPDVVLTFNLNGLGVFSIIQFLQKIQMPTIIYLMDNIFDGLDVGSPGHKKYEKVFGVLEFSSSTRIIAMSNNVTREVSGILNLDLGNVTYIPGWVNFVPQQLVHTPTKQRKETKFVFCSRVAQHKGIDIVIEAAYQLVQQGFTQFTIDVYGGGQLAPFLQKVKAKNLSDYIAYKGLVSKDQMLLVLSQYDALLFPTWEREAFGFVASEAAVAGCFPIMTAGIGASEWFLDGYDCLKISRDCTSVRSAMLQVMLWSDEVSIKNRAATLRSGRKNFSFDRWLSTIQEVCFDVIGTKPTSDLFRSTRGVESAFLFLSSLLKEAP